MRETNSITGRGHDETAGDADGEGVVGPSHWAASPSFSRTANLLSNHGMVGESGQLKTCPMKRQGRARAFAHERLADGAARERLAVARAFAHERLADGAARDGRPYKGSSSFVARRLPGSHILYDRGGKLAGFYLGSSLHLALEVVGDALLREGFGKRIDDRSARLAPTHVIEHHDARKHD